MEVKLAKVLFGVNECTNEYVTIAYGMIYTLKRSNVIVMAVSSTKILSTTT